jgi:hypothetical protein
MISKFFFYIILIFKKKKFMKGIFVIGGTLTLF